MSKKGATRKKQKTTGKRWSMPSIPVKGLVLSCTLLIVMAAGYSFVAYSPEIENVSIEGSYRYTEENGLRQVLKKHLPATYVDLDVAEVKASLESLPMIRHAWVKKGWPNKLDIQFEEEIPVASWEGTGYVNVDGDVLTGDFPENKSLPIFRGSPARVKEQIEGYTRLSLILKKLNFRVAELAVSLRNSWWIKLDNGLVVQLGQVEPIEKMKRVVLLMQKMSSRLSEVETIDARYTNGLAISWKDEIKQ